MLLIMARGTFGSMATIWAGTGKLGHKKDSSVLGSGSKKAKIKFLSSMSMEKLGELSGELRIFMMLPLSTIPKRNDSAYSVSFRYSH